MKIVKMETHMLSQKVIANVTAEFARVYNIPEGHTSVSFLRIMMILGILQ